MAPRVIRKKAAAVHARTRPSHTTTSSLSSSIGRSSAPKSTSRSDAFPSFPTTKTDKRRLKHSALVTRIEKKSQAQKPLKRRRPSKKLATTLESLADALPDTLPVGSEGLDVIGGGRLRHASLKSRPGAMKRKEKLEGLERERFARNLAGMAGGGQGGEDGSTSTVPGNGAVGGTAARWAALRANIQNSMGAIKVGEKK